MNKWYQVSITLIFKCHFLLVNKDTLHKGKMQPVNDLLKIKVNS
jgi:hypothetical protein